MAENKDLIVTGNRRLSGATVVVIAVVLLIALGLVLLYFGTGLLQGS